MTARWWPTAADIGQEEDWEAVKKKGLATGAEKVIISDLKKEFVEEYIFPGLSLQRHL